MEMIRVDDVWKDWRLVEGWHRKVTQPKSGAKMKLEPS